MAIVLGLVFSTPAELLVKGELASIKSAMDSGESGKFI
jgi:hypothetical protein